MRAKKCALKDRKCRRAKKCYRARRIFRIRHFVKRCKREDIFKRPIVHYHLHKKHRFIKHSHRKIRKWVISKRKHIHKYRKITCSKVKAKLRKIKLLRKKSFKKSKKNQKSFT